MQRRLSIKGRQYRIIYHFKPCPKWLKRGYISFRVKISQSNFNLAQRNQRADPLNTGEGMLRILKSSAWLLWIMKDYARPC